MATVKVNNVSGGVYRTATPGVIPDISWQDLSNVDVINKALITRDGSTKNNTLPSYPGCLKFGYSDTQRTHYVKAKAGNYGPDESADTRWSMFFYAKELTSGTSHESYLITMADTNGNALVQVYWGTDGRMHFKTRPHTGHSWDDYSGTSVTNIPRSGMPDHIYGISLDLGTADQYDVEIYDSSGQVINHIVSTTAAWATITDIIIGCDTAITYPAQDWAAATNKAYYGYFAELMITRNETMDSSSFADNLNVLPPGPWCAAANRIAYYPLGENYDDDWGVNPSFVPQAQYVSKAGLVSYLIRDPKFHLQGSITESFSRSMLYITKSWHVNTFDTDRHIFGRTPGASTNLLNPSSGKYSITFDIVIRRSGSGTSDFTLFETENYGAQIKLSRVDDNTTKIKFNHRFNATHSKEIVHEIKNAVQAKITCQYDNDTGVTNTFTMKIFHMTNEVISGTKDVSTSVTRIMTGQWILGTNTVSSINFEFDVSGLITHDIKAGELWAKRPQETIRDVTTVTEWSNWVLATPELLAGEHVLKENQPYLLSTPKVTSIHTERSDSFTPIYSLYDLPAYEHVQTVHLATEVTGYDTASSATPHGVLRNSKGASSSAKDFILRNNTAPVWIGDRNTVSLATTGFGDTIYADEPDNVFTYSPADSNLGNKKIIERNGTIIALDGSSYTLGDTYNTHERSVRKKRGIMYGDSLYFHNQEHILRFNGRAVLPVNTPAPIQALSLLADSSATGGLNGVYIYTYTTIDKNGFESYPAPVASVTVRTGDVNVQSLFRIYDESYINNCVQALRFYRSRGTVTGTTLLSNNSVVLKELRTIPLKTVRDKFGSTLFDDNTADSALIEASPPIANNADIIPKCDFSALYRDSALYTGDPNAPNHYYKSLGQDPSIFDRYDEFRTEDGQYNTAIAALGRGMIVFKKTARKYIRGSVGSPGEEYTDGGCAAHDSIVNVGGALIGLGDNGFFITDGHSYDDITTRGVDERTVSSIQFDVDTWSSAVKAGARAVYHDASSRYICHVNGKYYVFHTKRNVWLIYNDFLGIPFIHQNDFYLFRKGWLWEEQGDQAYVGSEAFIKTPASGSTGQVTVVTTDTMPTGITSSGLPVLIETSSGIAHYWIREISVTGTTYTVNIETNADLSGATKMRLGVIRAYADTKARQEDTPSRHKLWKRLLVEHDATSGGEMNIRLSRNEAAFNDAADHYTAKTTQGKSSCILGARAENLAIRFEFKDGLEHTLKNYTILYEQQSYD